MLSNNAVAVLGITIGFKAFYRRSEAVRYGIDFEDGKQELIGARVMRKNGSVDRKAGYKVLERYIGKKGASQTHMYMNGLGFYTDMDLMMDRAMEKLDAISIR